MIVREMMTTQLVTVEPDDTVSHAAHLFRQYQFHHLPVVRMRRRPPPEASSSVSPPPTLIFQGILNTHDIDMAVALGQQEATSHPLARPWQEWRVAEIMHRRDVWVTPTTS